MFGLFEISGTPRLLQTPGLLRLLRLLRLSRLLRPPRKNSPGRFFCQPPGDRLAVAGSLEDPSPVTHAPPGGCFAFMHNCIHVYRCTDVGRPCFPAFMCSIMLPGAVRSRLCPRTGSRPSQILQNRNALQICSYFAKYGPPGRFDSETRTNTR